MPLRLLILGLALLLPAAAPAAERGFLLDPTHRLTLAEARGAAFAPIAGASHNLGMTEAAVWVRVAVPAAPAVPQMLVIDHPVLDEVDAHVVDATGSVSAYRMGDLRPFAWRPYPHRAFVVPLPPDPAPREVYLRLVSAGNIVLPLRLLTEPAFHRRDALEMALFGGYFGVLIAMAAYNGFICLVVRDRSYVFYVAYVVAFGLLQALLNGFAAPLLDPGGLLDANRVLLLLYAAVIASGLLFVTSFLDTAATMPRWHRVLLGLAGPAVAAALLGLWLPYRPMLLLLLAAGAATLPLILGTVLWATLRRVRPARFLLLAFAALLPGCALFVLRTAGLVPDNLLTQHGLELSTALETVLLSFALADRMNQWRADKAAAELAAAQAHLRYSQRLARTMEEDRRRIARELHDSVGQTLLVAGNSLKRLEQGGRDPQLAEVADLVHRSVQDVRSVAHDLHPAPLERLGIGDALAGMLRRGFADSRVRLHLDIDAAGLAPHPARDVQIYRIAQEAMANVLRHADAANCWVRLAAADGGLVLSVADDGRGPGAAEGDGIGLETQRERARLIGATHCFAARPGGGTELRLEAPLEPPP